MPYPSIVLNRTDSVFGRIFNLVHEFSHLLLKKGGICTLQPEDEIHFEVDKFCKAVAGAALVPKNTLMNIDLMKKARNLKIGIKVH